MIVYKNSEIDFSEHLPEIRKTIIMLKNTSKNIKDYKLSRYDCYLIAQNGYSRKKILQKWVY